MVPYIYTPIPGTMPYYIHVLFLVDYTAAIPVAFAGGLPIL